MNTLRTDYVDAVTDEQRYKLTEVGNSEYLIEDVSDYSVEGSYFGAKQHNETNKAVNDLITLIESDAESAQAIINGTLSQNNVVATNAETSIKTQLFSDPPKINNVEFDGSEDITIEDATKVPKSKSFVLQANEALDFINNQCVISDDRITDDSLANVVFAPSSIASARKSVPTIETSNGALTIRLGRTSSQTLYANIYIRRP